MLKPKNFDFVDVKINFGHGLANNASATFDPAPGSFASRGASTMAVVTQPKAVAFNEPKRPIVSYLDDMMDLVRRSNPADGLAIHAQRMPRQKPRAPPLPHHIVATLR